MEESSFWTLVHEMMSSYFELPQQVHVRRLCEAYILYYDNPERVDVCFRLANALFPALSLREFIEMDLLCMRLYTISRIRASAFYEDSLNFEEVLSNESALLQADRLIEFCPSLPK